MDNNKNYYAEIEIINQRISDCTYYTFEKFISKGLPLLLDYAIKTMDSQIDFAFLFENVRESFGGKIADVSLLETSITNRTIEDFGEYLVNIDEFLSYLNQIPGLELYENTFEFASSEDEGTVGYSIDTIELTEFYYQELQRMEYIGVENKANSKKRM